MGLKNKIREKLDQYPRLRKFQFMLLERLTGYRVEKKRFRQIQGYELNLNNPKTFNEKVVWKKIYDRNPLLPKVADKYKVRDFVREKLGKMEADKFLIPLVFATDKPETIPFDSLPEEYIIKPNHSSGRNLFINEQSGIDYQVIINQCRQLLDEDFHYFWHEWAYQEIDRKIVIEKIMRDRNGELPNDIKFHMIHGECVFIQVDSERFTDHKRNLYDTDWQSLEVEYGYEIGKEFPKPKKLNEMLEIASKLSKDFDYIRVDLYDINNHIYFGELTNYPESGYRGFKPEKYDTIFGSKWRVVRKYWE